MTEQQILQKIAAWRAELDARGETVADYCRKNDLDYDAVYMVLRGRSQGRRGKAHKVHVALGLKHSSPILPA